MHAYNQIDFDKAREMDLKVGPRAEDITDGGFR